MKKWILLYIIAIIFSGGCKSKQNKLESANTKDTVKFFPIQEYYLQQLKYAESIGSRKYKITIEDRKTDSVTIDEKEFNQLVKQFSEPDITAGASKKFYKQNIFFDESTHSYTFNYTSINKSLPVESTDILVDPETNQVKRIFINKAYTFGDSSIIEKLSWKNDSSFSINKIIQYNNQPDRIQQIKVVWNKN
ncbi:MAG: hypothetical protein ABJA79_10720 [Parafilimonas sp.]